MLLPSLLLTAPAVQVLQPKLRLNQTYSYKVTSVKKEFEGATNKVTGTLVQTMPVQITPVKMVGGKMSVNVVTGPLIARGRSVGKSKAHTFDVDSANSWNGNAYALFGVVYPAGGAKPGQTWRGKFRADPPIIAGLNATYKLIKTMTQNGQKVALLSLNIHDNGACRTYGSGQLMVGAEDGIVRSGNLHFEVAFLRPGPNKVMAVNSHDALDYTIAP